MEEPPAYTGDSDEYLLPAIRPGSELQSGVSPAAPKPSSPYSHTEPNLTVLWRDLVSTAVRNRSRATARTLWAALASFGTFLVEHRYVSENPISGIRLPPQGPKPPHRYLSHDELAKVYAACRTDRERLIVRLLLHGLRAGQLLAIRPADIREDVLWIRPQKRNPWHPVALDAETLRLVSELDGAGRLERPHADATRSTGRGIPAPLPRRQAAAFDPSRSQAQPIIPLTYRRLEAIVGAIGKRAGVPGVKCHTFRHTFASQWMLTVGDAATLQQLGGWSSQKEIVQTYARSAMQEASITRSRHEGLVGKLLDP